jgi:hypothetical protein
MTAGNTISQAEHIGERVDGGGSGGR